MVTVSVVCAVLLAVVQLSSGTTLEKQLRQKCDTIPRRTFFNRKTLSCYAESDGCSDLHYLNFRYARLSSSERAELNTYGLSDKYRDICLFAYSTRCYDGEQYGDKCMILNEGNSCKYETFEFVPHNDQDIRNVVAFMGDHNSGSAKGVTIGITNDNGILRTIIKEEKIDYLRWNPEKLGSDNPRVSIITEGTNKGYMELAKNNEYPMLCYKYIEAEHIYKPSYPTTTTPAPTTTPGYEIAKQYILRTACTTNKLHGLYLGKSSRHRYYTDYKKWYEDIYYNTNIVQLLPVGYIVTDEIWTKISAKCPELKKFYVTYHTSNEATYIKSSNDQSIYTTAGHFYCAEREGYCGANYELVQMTSRPELGENNFYPTYAAEAAQNTTYFQPKTEKICWIWQ